jgi:metal-responsive CopG/Arc/MetJ family transcriptional regulator
MAAAEKMEPHKFRERPSLIKKAQAIADVRGDNFSEVLRDAVRAYIRTYEHQVPRDDQPAAPQVVETDEEN